jgi:DNA-binding transcriptional MerR regulator
VAVEKLQQIALYYQLGLKRDEIRDIMLDPNYDSNLVLDTLLAVEQAKKATVERHIAALEYLKLSGARNRLFSPLRGISLEELGHTILNIQNDPHTDRHFTILNDTQIKDFTKELMGLLNTLQQLEPPLLNDQPGADIIHKLFALGAKYMGSDGCPFILGLLVSATGEGSAFHEFSAKISPVHSQAVIRYLTQHPELYTSSLQEAPPVG